MQALDIIEPIEDIDNEEVEQLPAETNNGFSFKYTKFNAKESASPGSTVTT